ncbi:MULTISPECIES: osmotically-inducible lipoprotein OsmE [Pseudomonas]|uniref:osmotically-inducible lipoprotein OsmE n=1 Tax=Pseudomonas TaxID=286 RepID=UPI00301D59E5
MKTSLLALTVLLAAGSGCTTNSSLYRDSPLVSQIEPGMSKAQVLQVGGQPLSTTERPKGAGTCFDYMLAHQGQQHAYSINFNTAGTVENKSFSTCAQAGPQNTRKALDNMGGAGGAGY